MATTKATTLPFFKRLAWMVGIWAVSVGALGLVAGILRFWLKVT